MLKKFITSLLLGKYNKIFKSNYTVVLLNNLSTIY